MKPDDIPTANRILKRAYAVKAAPVIDFMAVQTREPFRVLVSTILSARTKDGTTTEVARRLFGVVRDLDALESIPLASLEKLLFPVGFYRTKARNLKALPTVVRERFEGRIPETVEDLCELPGVGRKTANLVVAVAFDKPAICVDVHVHRICNRWGLLQSSTPYETEMVLRRMLPVRYWKTWNRYLVAFGQTQCTPTRPRCDTCPLSNLCQQFSLWPGGPPHDGTTNGVYRGKTVRSAPRKGVPRVLDRP